MPKSTPQQTLRRAESVVVDSFHLPHARCGKRRHARPIRAQSEGPLTERASNQWWRGGGSNSRPPHCERGALPAELPPHDGREFYRIGRRLWRESVTPGEPTNGSADDTHAQDAAWLDVQYDNRRRVPSVCAHLARWRDASAQARAQRACHLDIPLRRWRGEQLDVFPAAQADAPVLVFIHGGYWRSLDKADHSFVAPAFTAAGAMVVVPNYSLCPAVTVEHIALQMAHALAWVHRHAADAWRRRRAHRRGRPLGGRASGCHAAELPLARLTSDLPPQLVRGALSISGLYDLEPLRRTPFLQVDLRLTPASVARPSPAALAGTRRRQLCRGRRAESEEFLRQNR